MQAQIYTLSDPRTRAIRYVGYSVDARKRLSAHLIDASTSHKALWIQSLRRHGVQPLLMVIEVVSSVEEARLREIYWSDRFRREGCDLTNTAPCGSLSPMLNPAIARKVGLTQRGKKLSDTHKAKLSGGRTHTLEGNKKQADSLRRAYALNPALREAKRQQIATLNQLRWGRA
jgi:hypothetical protein